MQGYLRGQAAAMAGINIETLRYYEKQGLIDVPVRSDAGYRLYSAAAIQRIAFIKNAKNCGFTLKEIKKALTRSATLGISTTDFVAVIDRKVASIRKEIAEKEKTLSRLEELRTSLLAPTREAGVQEVMHILKMEK
jgi:MerR family transcriptional regulator, Zn(II)-responsive regulator of zntA